MLGLWVFLFPVRNPLSLTKHLYIGVGLLYGWVVETFDYVVSQTTPKGVRLNLGRGSDPAKWEEAGWVEVTVDPDAARSGEVTIREVRISLPGPMTPSRLQRFPWARCLRVVEAVVRNPGPLYPPIGPDQRSSRSTYLAESAEAAYRINQTINEALHGQKPTGLKHRPGRASHPDDHYKRVADAYQALIATGEPAPNKRIADDWGYSRNTVAGWVRKARQLGYLPPAKKGRAG